MACAVQGTWGCRTGMMPDIVRLPGRGGSVPGVLGTETPLTQEGFVLPQSLCPVHEYRSGWFLRSCGQAAPVLCGYPCPGSEAEWRSCAGGYGKSLDW